MPQSNIKKPSAYIGAWFFYSSNLLNISFYRVLQVIFFPSLKRSAAAGKEGNDKEYQEDKEQYFGDGGCRRYNIKETEDACDNSNY